MSQSLLKIAADFTVQLASAVAIGDTAATLSSIADDDSVSLPSGLYGFTIDNGQSSKEYIICSLSGTALTSIKSISRQGSITTGFTKAHRRGASVSITDWAILKRILDNLDGTTGFDSGVNLGYDGAPTGLTGNQFATVNYVLSVVNGGTVTFDKQVIANQTSGEALTANDVVYFKESDQKWYKADADLTTTFDQLQIGIAASTVSSNATVQIYISGAISGFTGLTAGSKYYLSNTAGAITTTAGTYSVFIGWALSTTSLLFSPVLKTLPTQKEKDALVGSTGVPSTTNKYITQDNTSASTTDQTQSTQNGTIELGEADATTKKNKIAQSFIPTKTKIRGVNLYKSADTGTFTGTVTVSIQADSSGSPSGSALATKTFTNSEWLVKSVGDFEVLFSSEYASLVAGSLYWIVIETSTSDSSNHPNVGTNTAGGYANGSIKYKNTTDSWVAVSTIDLYFKTLEGNESQIVKTNTSGKIESSFYDTSEMPLPVYSQILGVDVAKFNIASPDNAFGSNQDGSVFYIMTHTGGYLGRFERDSLTGNYLLTHEIDPTISIPSGDTGAIIVIGDYVYLFSNNGTNTVCSRFLAADLTGEQVMTVPTVTDSGFTNAWTDGTYAYVVVGSSDTTSRKWSVSGTTFTAVSTTTCVPMIGSSTMHDGTNTYSVSYDPTTGYPGPSAVIKKFADINNSSTASTTTKKIPYMSDLMLGSLIINIDTSRMYIGSLYAIYDETAAISTGIILVPITKP